MPYILEIYNEIVDEKRTARYMDKLAHMRERIEDVLAWIDEAEGDKKSRLAIYKAMQEAVESICDIGCNVYQRCRSSAQG